MAWLHQTCNILKESDKELTRNRMTEQRLTDMLESKTKVPASDKNESEIQELLKSHKALSRAVSYLETLKKELPPIMMKN